MSHEDIRRWSATAKVVIFDFDGPLCDVFAGYPAWRVARELENVLGSTVDTDDPLQVLRESSTHPLGKVLEIEHELVAAELRAVSCSTATPGGLEAVKACVASGRVPAVVSNNSADAVRAFLGEAGLLGDVKVIVGREPGRPDLMKPNPWPMQRAFTALDIAAQDAVFVGDTSTDLEVAAVVGVPCLAYANKPGKREAFQQAGAAAVFSDMSLLASALAQAQPCQPDANRSDR